MSPLPDLHIRSSLANYTVAFSDLSDLSKWQPSGDGLIIDSFFQGRLSLAADLPVIWINSSESAKELTATLPVFEALKQAGFGRGSHLAAIGGGVVQDIATFVASLYMRGISWSYTPTTFLGMTDSCLGGKSSINAGTYKNLIGNFHPPKRIDILPVFARTLPAQELSGGASEAAKIAFCKGGEAFAMYEALATPILEGNWNEEQLSRLLHSTLSVKKWFIEIDEFDKAERRLLNFGHTWGHALESATHFAIPHGLAVAAGMMAAISYTGHHPSSSGLWNHCLALLTPVLSRDQLTCFDTERFASAFQADKKHSGNHYHLIVPAEQASPDALGVLEIQIDKNQQSMQRVITAMQESIDALLLSTKGATAPKTDLP